MLARWECRLPVLAVSQNSLHAKGTVRWAYTKYKRQVMSALVEATEVEGQEWPNAKGKRRVLLTRYWAKKQRAYDRINLAGGMKPVLDCLVELGLLVDDNEAYCEDHYAQEGPSDQPGIGVVIEEVG